MDRFYWVVERSLAGCSRPGAHGQGQGKTDLETPEALQRDLDWLRGQGIGALLSLTETPLLETGTDHGLTILHLPVPDLQAPTPDELLRALAFIDRQRAAGRAIAVHCLMGQGRTGTVLAAYRIRTGIRPEDALQSLRTICPGAVSSPAQEQALRAFAARRDWLI